MLNFNHMKNFLKSIKKSLSDKSFYQEIAAGQEQTKVRYMFGLATIATLIILSLFTITSYTHMIPELRTIVTENIKPDLVLTLKSGELSLNQPVPYAFTQSSKNMIVIDTNASTTFDALDTYKTAVFINKTNLILRKSSGEVRLIPLKGMPDFTLTQASVLHMIDVGARYLWILVLIAFIPVLLLEFLGIILTVLFSGCILWVILKITSHPLLFKQTYIATAYSYTFIFFINTILWVFDVWVFGFFLSSLITATIAWLFIGDSKKPEVVSEVV